MKQELIYLDNAATTPVDPRVIEAMTACLGADGDFANPSSAHSLGSRARRLVEEARARIAARVSADPAEIVFTSGATESNNLALRGVLNSHSGRRKHLITTRIEHHAVLDTARVLQSRGFDVTYLECNACGVITAEQVSEAIRDDTALVSVMHVNNEIGVIQDIAKIAEVSRSRGILMHVDAAQSAGKIPIDLKRWPIDLCSLTAHKAHGPKGIGALYVRQGLQLEPLMYGGAQEGGLRAGTLATHQIVGMGEAFHLADPEHDGPRLEQLRSELWQGLRRIDAARLNGDPEQAAPHILNVCFPGVEGESLRLALSDIAVSEGAACASDTPEPSHVLSSLGLSDALAQSSLRLSVGRFTRPSDVAYAIDRLSEEVARLRELARSAPSWCSS